MKILLNNPVDESIVIVGGGASATLLFAQLSIQLNTLTSKPINIYIIDDSPSSKLGVAYSVPHPSFLLNVSANKMGAYWDKPGDFYVWLKEHPELWRNLHSDFNQVQYQEEDFLPRMIYGAYLQWVFDSACVVARQKNIKVHLIPAHVVQIIKTPDDQHFIVRTIEQHNLIADTVILATGNKRTTHQNITHKHIFPSPYQQKFISQDWSHVNNIVILGTGLSMVDTVQFLIEQNYKGNIHAISRHGLSPLPHAKAKEGLNQGGECTPFNFKNIYSARKVITIFRKKLYDNLHLGITWQETINQLRLQSNELWLSLPEKKQQTLKKILPFWNIARHRIPLSSYQLLNTLKNQGKLTIIKSNVTDEIIKSDGSLLFFYNNDTLVKADKIVICSGYAFGFEDLKNLCGDLISPKEELQNSFNANQFGYKLSKDHSIYAMGPTLRGFLFETTAIHEIREQSYVIASAITKRIYHKLSRAII